MVSRIDFRELHREELMIPFPESRHEHYRIVLDNGDNPALTITGSQNRVRIDAFNGTPFVLGLVQQGQVEMDIGENLDWIGHAIIDAEMRLICGLPPVKDPKIPFYIFDKSNAHRAGSPPELSKGYGDAYIDGYLKLWRLK